MTLLSRWVRRLVALVRPDETERAMDAEMRHHLEMEALELQARGMDANEARKRAAVLFGGIERFKDEAREVRPLRPVENLVRDARYAFRQLNRSRAFSFSAALLLALGIGGTVTVFGVLNTIYYRPLPYPNAARLVAVQVVMTGVKCNDRCARDPDGDEAAFFAAGAPSVEKLGTIRVTEGVVYLPGRTSILKGAAVSASLPELLGFKAALGRTLTNDDYAASAPAVMLLSRSAWLSEFGGDSSIVGRSYTLGDVSFTIVGVLNGAAELGSPLYAYNSPGTAQYIVPDRASQTPLSSSVLTLVRLHEGAQPARLRTELDLLIKRRVQSGAAAATAQGYASVEPLRDSLSRRYRASFGILLGAVGAVLLITCLNVTGLFLARLADRAPELATRTALGASRYRLAQQIGSETLVIALAGGLGGIAIAQLGMSATRWLPAGQLPFWDGVSLDITTVVFAALLTIAAGCMLSVAPVWVLSPNRLLLGLRGAVGASRSRSRLRGVLVCAQVSLSVMLLAAAGLLTKVLLDAELRDIGTSKHNMLYVLLQTPPFESNSSALSLEQRLVEQLRAVPGVTAAAVEGTPPRAARNREPQRAASGALSANRSSRVRPPAMTIEGQPEGLPGSVAPSGAESVSPGYFTALGKPLLRGRAFTDQDQLTSIPVAVLDEPTARRMFGTQDALGKRVKFGGPSDDQPWLTIVGIVAGSTSNPLGIDNHYSPRMYRSIQQFPASPSTIIVHFAGASQQIAAVRTAVRNADASLPIANVLTVEQSIGLRMWPARFNAFTLGAFALFAVLLSCLGIYAAVSFAVAARQREIAVRVALGAFKREVILLLMGATSRLVVIGIALGLAGSMFATRAIRSMLFGAQPLNAWVLAAAVAAMMLTSLAAAFLPARRAAQMDSARLLNLS